ncbi:MAG: hypothetical protein FD153_86 [Rhodospirillaceae bacterium]|nr:MAG: hypothetical protein FD153_86 [Rhodospirillaceae bacterium]
MSSRPHPPWIVVWLGVIILWRALHSRFPPYLSISAKEIQLVGGPPPNPPPSRKRTFVLSRRLNRVQRRLPRVPPLANSAPPDARARHHRSISITLASVPAMDSRLRWNDDRGMYPALLVFLTRAVDLPLLVSHGEEGAMPAATFGATEDIALLMASHMFAPQCLSSVRRPRRDSQARCPANAGTDRTCAGRRLPTTSSHSESSLSR